MASIQIDSLCQNYGSVRALKGVGLEVEEGEFFSLLGPSGCGKTTLLRLIAGFEPPVSGSIRIAGEEVSHLPPEKRRIGMVFQNYALFPHLNVFENVAYGLRAAKESAATIKTRVGDMLDLVELSEYSQRDIHALSGGQQQRVALARALAPHPRLLLMDEPLSNLDARLRLQTRTQIKQLQKKVGMTTLYVTHDQSEALSLSDRLAVMFEGEIAQVGAPLEVYHRPFDWRVGEFLGELNRIECNLQPATSAGRARVEMLGRSIELLGDVTELPAVGPCEAAFRPESLGRAGMYEWDFEGRIESLQFEGIYWRIEVRVQNRTVLILWPTPWLDASAKAGDLLAFSVGAGSLMWLPPLSGSSG